MDLSIKQNDPEKSTDTENPNTSQLMMTPAATSCDTITGEDSHPKTSIIDNITPSCHSSGSQKSPSTKHSSALGNSPKGPPTDSPLANPETGITNVIINNRALCNTTDTDSSQGINVTPLDINNTIKVPVLTTTPDRTIVNSNNQLSADTMGTNTEEVTSTLLGINNSSVDSCDTSIMHNKTSDTITDSAYLNEYPSDPHIDATLSSALDRVHFESSLIGNHTGDNPSTGHTHDMQSTETRSWINDHTYFSSVTEARATIPGINTQTQLYNEDNSVELPIENTPPVHVNPHCDWW